MSHAESQENSGTFVGHVEGLFSSRERRIGSQNMIVTQIYRETDTGGARQVEWYIETKGCVTLADLSMSILAGVGDH